MASLENLKVLIALLPGFLSQRISHYFGTTYKSTDLNIFITALAFTFVNFLISIPIAKLFNIDIKDDKKNIKIPFIVVLLIVSIFTGGIWAVIDRKDILHNLYFTTKVSQANFWTKIFNINSGEWKAAAKVTLKNNQVYIGWPRYWSEQQEQNNCVFLNRANLLHKDGSCTEIDEPGIMLFEKDVRYIEFIKIDEKKNLKHPCKKK